MESKSKIIITGDNSAAIKAIQQTEKEFAELRDNAISDLKAINSAGENLSPSGNKSSAKDRDLFKDDAGDLSSSFGALGGAIGALGGSQQAQEAARTIGDVTGAIEYIPAAFAAIASSATVFLPLVAVGAAVAAAFSLVAESQRRAEESAKAYSDQLLAQIELQREVSGLVAQGDKDGLQAKIAAAAAETEHQKAIVDTALAAQNAAQIQKDLANANQGITKQYQDGLITWEDYLKQLEDFDATISGNKILETAIPAYQKATSDYQSLITTISASDWQAVNSEVTDFNLKLDGLTGVLDKNTVAGLRNANTTEERTAAIERAESALSTQRQASADQLQALNDQEKALNAQFIQSQTDLILGRQLTEKRAFEDRAIAAMRASIKLDDQLEANSDAHNARMIDIQDRANTAIADAQKTLAKAETKAVADRLEVETDYAKSIGELQSEYQENAKKSAAEYLKKRQEIEDSFEQDRQDAILNNDTLAFEKASKDEEKKALGELRNERKSDKQDLKKQLEEERQKVYDNYTERLSQIDSELQKQRDATKERLNEIETQTRAALDSEQETFDAKLLLDEKQRARDKQWADDDLLLAQARREEDARLQKELAERNFLQQYNNLNALEAKQLESYTKFDEALQAILDKTTQLETTISGESSGGWWDQLIPQLPPTTGTQSSLSGGQSARGGGGVTVNHYATYQVGELITPTELQNTVNQVQAGVTAALQLISGMTGL